MNCPACSETLLMTERSGVEIDYCPKCRGVWLDRGELDKIVERTDGGSASARPEAYREIPRIKEEPGYPDSYYKPKKRKESFLGELFDF